MEEPVLQALFIFKSFAPQDKLATSADSSIPAGPIISPTKNILAAKLTVCNPL